MRILSSLAAFALLLGTIAFGEEVVETVFYDGKYYHDARIERVTKDSVAIITSKDGPGKIPIDSLSPLLKAQAANMIPPTIDGRVMQRVQGGMLITGNDETVFLFHYPNEAAVADHDRIRVFAKLTGSYHYTSAEGALATVHAYEFTAQYVDPRDAAK